MEQYEFNYLIAYLQLGMEQYEFNYFIMYLDL